jgi:ribonuclease D
VTVDTEFLRETTFWPKLCVVQMAGPDEATIIGVLAPDIELSLYWPWPTIA